MKLGLILVAAFFAVGEANPVIQGKDAGKVIQYDDKEIVLNAGEFGYLVHLEIRRVIKLDDLKTIELKISYCGGSLLTTEIVLTAAHCIGLNKPKPKIFAWAGILDTKKEEDNGERIPVKSYRLHEKYVEGHQYGIFCPNDIALMWMEKPFQLNEKTIKLAMLPEATFKAETKRGWIVGWGYTECGERSPMLQKAVLRAISQQECEPYFQSIITNYVICVKSDTDTSMISKGDSGGPFVVQGKVVGIASFGSHKTIKKSDGTEVESCDRTKPGVFTDVTKYLDWIDEKIKQGPPVKKSKCLRQETWL